MLTSSQCASWQYIPNERIDWDTYQHITDLRITTHPTVVSYFVLPPLKPFTHLIDLRIISNNVLGITDYPDTLEYLHISDTLITDLGYLPETLVRISLNNNRGITQCRLPLSLKAFHANTQHIDVLTVGKNIHELALYKCTISYILGLQHHPKEMFHFELTHCISPYERIYLYRFRGERISIYEFKQYTNRIQHINREIAVGISSQLCNISATIYKKVNTQIDNMAVRMFANGSNYARRMSEFLVYI